MAFFCYYFSQSIFFQSETGLCAWVGLMGEARDGTRLNSHSRKHPYQVDLSPTLIYFSLESFEKQWRPFHKGAKKKQEIPFRHFHNVRSSTIQSKHEACKSVVVVLVGMESKDKSPGLTRREKIIGSSSSRRNVVQH